MSDYAIIKTGGKQYRVRPGDTVEVEKIEGDAGDQVVFDDVLLASKDGTLSVGAPTLDSARVEAEIAGQVKGKKVISFKYMSKTRRRRKKGHRQNYTSLLIKDISVE